MPKPPKRIDLGEILPGLVLSAMQIVEALIPEPRQGRRKKQKALEITRAGLTAMLRAVDLPGVEGDLEVAIEDATVEALIEALFTIHFKKGPKAA